MNISSLSNNPLNVTSQLTGSQSGTGSNSGTQGGLSFSDMVNQKMEEANSLQKQADQMTNSYLAGGPVDIQQMLIAMEKADLALRETTEIRNKVIDAYQEIEKMQI